MRDHFDSPFPPESGQGELLKALDSVSAVVAQLKQILDPSSDRDINGVGAALLKAAKGETEAGGDSSPKSEVGPAAAVSLMMAQPSGRLGSRQSGTAQGSVLGSGRKLAYTTFVFFLFHCRTCFLSL